MLRLTIEWAGRTYNLQRWTAVNPVRDLQRICVITAYGDLQRIYAVSCRAYLQRIRVMYPVMLAGRIPAAPRWLIDLIEAVQSPLLCAPRMCRRDVRVSVSSTYLMCLLGSVGHVSGVLLIGK
jgi:hypothetical protein